MIRRCALPLIGLVLMTSCQTPPPPTVEEPSPPAATADAAVAPAVDAGAYQAAAITPPRAATLTAEQTAAEINLRAQPTTQATAVGSAIAGDRVTLYHLAEGEGGYSWYYAELPQENLSGWVRGDFVTADAVSTAAPAAPATATASSPVEVTAEAPCGSDRQESLFETPTFIVTICKTTEGLRYVGTDKSNDNALVTETVQYNQGTYVAINGAYQYHVDDELLVIYQVDTGQYTQLTAEPVTHSERFVY